MQRAVAGDAILLEVRWTADVQLSHSAMKRSERAFGKDEVSFLEQVAGPVAIAVEKTFRVVT